MSELGSGDQGSFGQRTIKACLDDHVEEIHAMDRQSVELMERLLGNLCERINAERAALLQEAAERRKEKQQLMERLNSLAQNLSLAEAYNVQLKEKMEELMGEVQQRQQEWEMEVQELKLEVQRVHSELGKAGDEQAVAEEVFRECQIKMEELEQQKLLLFQQVAKEEGKRKQLELQLHAVQAQLMQLSLHFQHLQRSHEELSQSLQSKEQRIRQLNRIIQESEYVDSLSPRSRFPDPHEQDNSYASQQLASVLAEEQLPFARLSQSHLLEERSRESILSKEDKEDRVLEVPKTERAVIASASKTYGKAVLSHQKKEDLSLRKELEKHSKEKSKTIVLFKHNSTVVRSKLTSIFRDRLKYKSDQDQLHQERVNQLSARLKEREEEVERLRKQIAMLQAVRAEPVVVKGNSKDGRREVHMLRSQNESLRRISKEIALRKEYVEYELQECKEKCAYYKSEHKKLYQQYLLKKAESVAYEEQLSQLEGEWAQSFQQREKDEFEDLSNKFNNLVLRHSHAGLDGLQQPSFKSGNSIKQRDFYTVQNIPLIETPMEELLLDGIEEIAVRENNQEIQTERFILSQLMQTSRRENSITQFQLLFSEHPNKVLKLTHLGCMAAYQPQERTLAICHAIPVVILPRKRQFYLSSFHIESFSPRQKCSVSVGECPSFGEAHIQTQLIPKEEASTSTNTIQLKAAQSQTDKQSLNTHCFQFFHQNITKSKLQLSSASCMVTIRPLEKRSHATNTDKKQSRSSSTNCQSINLQLLRQVSSLTIQPTARGSSRLQIDLSFLKNNGQEQQSIRQKVVRGRNLTVPQVTSCRTRASSQEIPSHRSELTEKPKQMISAAADMEESAISEQSEGSERTIKNEIDSPFKDSANGTAQHTPFVPKKEKQLCVSSVFKDYAEVQVREAGLSEDQVKVVKEYFYRLTSFQLVQQMESSQKNHLSSYDFQSNMYVFWAERGGRREKFACWRGRVIHFGRKVETMELTSRTALKFSGSVSLGNSEWRIWRDRVQVRRATKKRSFRGEMEEGEWRVQRTFVYAAN